MTTYNAITDSQVDPDAPLTSQLGYQWRDNPIAMAEGSAGAPYVAAGWHPYDGVTVGDGADGVIYDFAVDGAVSSVTTPDFVDGFEYQIHYYGLTASSGTPTLQTVFYRETTAAFSGPWATITMSAATGVTGINELTAPMVSSRIFRFMDISPVEFATNGNPSTTAIFPGVLRHTTAQKILRAKLAPSTATTFSSGKIFMMKRSCYVPA